VEFIITQDFHEVRLDRFIRQKYREIPLTGIFRLIRKGRIRVNGRKKKPDYRLQENDVVHVNISTPPSAAKPFVLLSPDQRKLAAASIVYEDNNKVVCNKPPGLAMHRGSRHEFGLVELLQSYTKNPQFTFVNRIDKATAGLVIGSKNLVTSRKLSELFRQQSIEKQYAIIVDGLVDQDHFTITSFLKKEDDRVEEYTNAHDGAKKAISSFSVVERYTNTTLLEARLLTGRTHQLRVQLANRNHPIVGDMKYGNHRAQNLLLFSRRVVIPDFNLDVSLPVPEYFHR
jgi:23S rRNA pseudouridine955/2504/2580 synthase